MTPNSMTGYARIQGHDDTVGWVWEIKTVNGRGLELKTRLPIGFDALDLLVREAAQKRLKRGSVTLSLTVNRERESHAFAINEALLARYAEIALKLHAEAGSALAPASIDGLMGLKGVIEASEAEDSAVNLDGLREPMLADFTHALDALCAMRAAEGERLGTVLGQQLTDIEALVGRAEADAALDPAAISARLKEQVAALLDAQPTFSEDRLLQEAALIVAKADVREELDRLRAHIAAARDMLSSGEAVGRKLDFLCQEFNREANTLCSKAGMVSLTRIGMDLKAVIEQFREQVQNIE